MGMLAEKDSPHTESNVANICSRQRDLENTDHMAPRESKRDYSRCCWIFFSEFCSL